MNQTDLHRSEADRLFKTPAANGASSTFERVAATAAANRAKADALRKARLEQGAGQPETPTPTRRRQSR